MVGGLAPFLVEDDARAGGGNVTVALIHVEGLEILDRVALLRRNHRARHDLEQVDEAALALQLVHRRLGNAMMCGQPAQRRNLVVGVVVDVGAGMAAEVVNQERQQVGDGAPLGVAVVCPEGPEHPLAFIAQPQAVEVFESARIIGIALDVVEHVTVVCGGQHAKPLTGLGVAQLEAGRAARAPIGLQPRLRGEPGLGLDSHPRHPFGARSESPPSSQHPPLRASASATG